MRRALPVLLILAALAAPALRAQVLENPSRLDLRPLLQLTGVGNDIAGGELESDVLITRGGAVFFLYSAETGSAQRVDRGVATREQLVTLNQALARARVAQQRGGCGDPAPDGISTYTLLWNGKSRTRQISVGGIYLDCPADTRQVFDAVCTFVWDVLGPTPELCVPPV
ncbi:MAG TPA: hypothetical protein VJ725_34380 [Thermoanaerobaculia bacterium]|nr:hypothetical protein [Thermoanaerobaculia bacterium]